MGELKADAVYIRRRNRLCRREFSPYRYVLRWEDVIDALGMTLALKGEPRVRTLVTIDDGTGHGSHYVHGLGRGARWLKDAARAGGTEPGPSAAEVCFSALAVVFAP